VLQELSAHALVYQALDEVLAGESVPPGVRGAMFAVIDDLRANSAVAEDARRAEQISVEIHKLEWALRQGDADAAKTARETLKGLAADWINRRICARH
jgi:hypothetical protein